MSQAGKMPNHVKAYSVATGEEVRLTCDLGHTEDEHKRIPCPYLRYNKTLIVWRIKSTGGMRVGIGNWVKCPELEFSEWRSRVIDGLLKRFPEVTAGKQILSENPIILGRYYAVIGKVYAAISDISLNDALCKAILMIKEEKDG